MDGNTVHIGTDDKATSWWRWFTRRIVIIPIAAVIIVVLGVWVFRSVTSNHASNSASIQKMVTAANDSFATGNYSASANTLKAAVSQSSDDKEKADLYGQLAASAASAGQLADAINYLNKRHEIDPSTAGPDAYMLGTYYERTGQKGKAIDQYKAAIAYINGHSKGTTSNADVKSLQQRIQALQD